MIAKNKDFPARVRFLLQDVIDSRKNNWKPRREKAGPKTIDQIHKEAESEKLNQQVLKSFFFNHHTPEIPCSRVTTQMSHP